MYTTYRPDADRQLRVLAAADLAVNEQELSHEVVQKVLKEDEEFEAVNAASGRSERQQNAQRKKRHLDANLLKSRFVTRARLIKINHIVARSVIFQTHTFAAPAANVLPEGQFKNKMNS